MENKIQELIVIKTLNDNLHQTITIYKDKYYDKYCYKTFNDIYLIFMFMHYINKLASGEIL